MSMSPTPKDIVVVHNSGGRYPNACARLGWDYFANEIAAKYEFNFIHLLSHWMTPMQFDQWSYIKKTYPGLPISDAKQFSKSMRKFSGWWSFYMGSPETFAVNAGETDRRWLSRAIDEIRPIIDARPDVLWFDAFQEVNAPRYQLLIDRLRNVYEMTLGAEPCVYADQTQMHDWPIQLSSTFRRSRENPKGSGWDTGKNAARPLRVPNLHPLVLERPRTSYLEEDIRDARRSGHVPAINIGHIGKVMK